MAFGSGFYCLLVVYCIHNSVSCILNNLLFLQEKETFPLEKMCLVQHFGSFGLNQYDDENAKIAEEELHLGNVVTSYFL